MSDFDASSAIPEFDPSSAQPEASQSNAAPTPKAAPEESFGQQVSSYLTGINHGLYAIPQNAARYLAAGSDAIGLTDNAHQDVNDALSSLNQADYNAHGVNPQSKYTQGGNFVGNAISAAPLAEFGPFMGGAAMGAGLSDSTTPEGVLRDIAVSGIAGKGGDLAMSGLSAAAKPVASYLGNKFSSAGAPLTRAAQNAGHYISGLMDSAGKTPQDLSNFAVASGTKPVTAAEAIGPSGISAVSALARRQGATGDAASALLGERASGTPDRILADYAQAAGVVPEAAQGDIDKLVQAGRGIAKPLFDQSLSTPGPIWNSDLQVISKRPVVQDAIKSTVQDLLNSDTHPSVLGLPSGPDDGALLPTAQAWDLIRKNVNDQIERDPFGKAIPDSASRGNYNVNKTSKDLTSALKTAIPGYGDALSASGDYLSLQKAFNDGSKFILSPTFTADQMANYTSKLTPAELEAFKGGTANALYNKAQNGQLHPSVFKRPILQDKLATVLGPDKAQPFLQGMQTEASMAKSGARMAPGTNSVTGEVANATNEQDQNTMNGVLSSLKAAQHMGHGNVLGTAAHLKTALQDFGVIAKNPMMPVPVRDEAGKLLLMKPDDLVSHLQTLYGSGGPAAVQRVQNFIGQLKPIARTVTPVLAQQALQTGP